MVHCFLLLEARFNNQSTKLSNQESQCVGSILMLFSGMPCNYRGGGCFLAVFVYIVQANSNDALKAAIRKEAMDCITFLIRHGNIDVTEAVRQSDSQEMKFSVLARAVGN